MGEHRTTVRPEVGSEHLTASPLIVRVRPDLTALDDTFRYLVPEKFGPVEVGTMVRIPLSGRRVNGWIVPSHSRDSVGHSREGGNPERQLSEILAVRSIGPSQEIIDLATWAGWRWCGNPSAFLDSASPDTNVKALPKHRHLELVSGSTESTEESKYFDGVQLVRVPPSGRKSEIIEHAINNYHTPLILFPTYAQARAAAKSVQTNRSVLIFPDDWAGARIGGQPIFGTRRAAWVPCSRIDAVVVIDAHDHRYKEERAPAWNAIDVAIERAKRDQSPVVLVSPSPTVRLQELATNVSVSRGDERSGWPEISTVDLRTTDPRHGLLTEEVTRLIRSDQRVLIVLNRKGYASLLVCGSCGAASSCERCGARVVQRDEDLECTSCGLHRPKICQACNSQKLKTARVGVSKLKDELNALVGQAVDEITKESDQQGSSRVVIGTEAALYRTQGKIDQIVFLDFDQELLAPYVGAQERALAMIARAGRLVGARGKGGRIVLQSRHPENVVIQAAEFGDPTRVSTAERKTLESLNLPPYSAVAFISGAVAEEFVKLLPNSLEIVGPTDGRYMIRASNTDELCNAFSSVRRPPGKMRVEIDPLYF